MPWENGSTSDPDLATRIEANEAKQRAEADEQARLESAAAAEAAQRGQTWFTPPGTFLGSHRFMQRIPDDILHAGQAPAAAPPAPKPAAPPPSVTAPLNPKHADKPGPWRDRYVTDGPPSMPGAADAAPATPAPAARRHPIRMIRGADGSMKFTNVGDEGEIAVDNGVSTDWATKAGAPSAGTFTQPAVSDVAMVPDYVLENADRSARLLQAQRMIERLQAGPGVGPAHATAGEQLDTQRQTATKESLRQDRDSALSLLSNQLASRQITPEEYAASKLEIERAYGIDAGVDPRFYSRPY